MPITALLQIKNPEIRGSNTSKGFENQIKVFTFDYSAVSPAGRPTYSAITVTIEGINAPAFLTSLSKSQTHDMVLSILSPVNGVLSVTETYALTGAMITGFRDSVAAGSDYAIYELTIACPSFQVTYTDPNKNKTIFQR